MCMHTDSGHVRKYSEYWLSTTGCPLIAATLGPVANLLSVCALVQSFRVDAKDRADQEADPHWYV